MTNTQITQENIYEIIVPRPRFDAVPVYVDGERDKTREIARYASYGAKMVGYATWKIATLGFKALDHAIEAQG